MQLSHSRGPGLMLRRIPLLADTRPEALTLLNRSILASMGAGGYFMKGSRTLLAGLHVF